jgi:hypothetical protein
VGYAALAARFSVRVRTALIVLTMAATTALLGVLTSLAGFSAVGC